MFPDSGPLRAWVSDQPATCVSRICSPTYRLSLRSVNTVLTNPRQVSCALSGERGAACRVLTARGALPLCYPQRARTARSVEDLSAVVGTDRAALRRLSGLFGLLGSGRLFAIVDGEPVLGWELVHLAVCGGADAAIAPWRSLLVPSADPALRQLALAALVTHGVGVPERAPGVAALLRGLPASPERDAAIATLQAVPSAAERQRLALCSADRAERLEAVQAWSVRLAGRSIGESARRRLATRLGNPNSGPRLCAELLEMSSNQQARRLLQRLGERRKRGRAAPPPVRSEIDDALQAQPEPRDDDWHGWGSVSTPEWRLPSPDPIQQAALRFLQRTAPRTWSSQLGDRLGDAQRALMMRAVGEQPAAPALSEQPLDARLPAIAAALQDPGGDVAMQRLAEAISVTLQSAEGARRLGPLLQSAPRAVWPLAWAARDHRRLPDVLPDACASRLAVRLARPQAPALDFYGGYQPPRLDALFTLGAGSLGSLDYPPFSLVVRPAVSTVAPAHQRALSALCGELAGLRAALRGEALLVGLASAAGVSVPDEAPAALHAHIVAYATLRETVFASGGQIRAAHIRRFWSRSQARPGTLSDLSARLVAEGAAHALLLWSRQPPWADASLRPERKRVWAHLLRLVSLVYEQPAPPVARDGDEDEDLARRQVDHLLQALEHAPLELVQALRLGHRQGLPRLGGGARSPLEQRGRRLLRAAFRIEVDQDGFAETYTCRPLPKAAALDRGTLGGDCSSRAVPFRALSPHHVYYGLFQGETQRRGYLATFEAFAVDASGHQEPILVLETINIPDGALDTVQQDLLRMFAAIARRRGLSGLAVVMGIGTWNFSNQRVIGGCRRYRRGAAVRLAPADPHLWRVHEQLTGEQGYYCAFRARCSFVRLAPFDPERDIIQPENAAEAARLESAPGTIAVTGRDAHGRPAAFISGPLRFPLQ